MAPGFHAPTRLPIYSLVIKESIDFPAWGASSGPTSLAGGSLSHGQTLSVGSAVKCHWLAA